MTENEEELIRAYPTLFHTAELDSWESIRANGLLSTSALLDLYGIEEQKRKKIEREHRLESVSISADGLPDAVIRDQKPMPPDKLQKLLLNDIKPEEWYILLNRKVFFWPSKNHLKKLMNAREYRNREHIVLEIDTRSLIEAHRERIFLCSYNSGSTYNGRKRDKSIFKRIEDYSDLRKGVEELTVENSVPDICNHVRKVFVQHKDEVISVVEDFS